MHLPVLLIREGGRGFPGKLGNSRYIQSVFNWNECSMQFAICAFVMQNAFQHSSAPHMIECTFIVEIIKLKMYFATTNAVLNHDSICVRWLNTNVLWKLYYASRLVQSMKWHLRITVKLFNQALLGVQVLSRKEECTKAINSIPVRSSPLLIQFADWLNSVQSATHFTLEI